MTFPFEQSAMKLIDIAAQIAGEENKKLKEILELAPGLGFAFSWVHTWFSHSFSSFEKLCRIYDFLISSPPQAATYLAAAFLLLSRKQLNEAFQKENKGEPDVGVLFLFYQNENINNIKIDLAEWFKLTEKLMNQYSFPSFIKKFDLPEKSAMRKENFAEHLKENQEKQSSICMPEPINRPKKAVQIFAKYLIGFGVFISVSQHLSRGIFRSLVSSE